MIEETEAEEKESSRSTIISVYYEDWDFIGKRKLPRFIFPAVGFPFGLKVSGVIDSLNVFDFIEGIDEVLDLFLIFRT